MHVCDVCLGHARWKDEVFIKVTNDSYTVSNCERQWVLPEESFLNVSPSWTSCECKALSSTVLCNIRAIIPIMNQNHWISESFEVTYCRAAASFYAQILEGVWHFCCVYIFRQIRKSFKQVKWKYYPYHIEATYIGLIAMHGAMFVTSIDCVAFRHDIQKANIYFTE